MSPQLSRSEFLSMYTGLADEPSDPSLYHYACNLIRQANGTLIQRAPLKRIATAVTGNILAAGTLRTRITPIDWILTDTPTLYIVVSGVPTSTVSAANFTTATITVAAFSASQLWCSYSDSTKDYIVFANTGTVPFAWDGTAGATSLTKLTNAPNAAAAVRPTIHAGKLFFVKASDKRTIAWSEEYAINTGYEAGGYTNVWTLAQTSPEGLSSILGTNAGLYFSRRHSVGLIRGNVSPDFQTSATQDAVSPSVGCLGELVQGGNDIWFVDPADRIWVCPIGGSPVEVPYSAVSPNDPVAISADERIEPFGYGDLSSVFLSGASVIAPAVYLPNAYGLMGPTIWFMAADTSGGATFGALVIDAIARRPIGWVKWGHDTSVGFPLMCSFESQAVSNNSPATIQAIAVNDSARTRMYVLGSTFSGGAVFTGGDENPSGTAQTTTYRFISGPIALPGTGVRIGDLQLELFGRGSISGTAAVITSRLNNTSLITPASWSATFSSSYREVKTIQLGWEDEARWGRIMVVVSSSTLSDFGIRRVWFEGQPVDLSDVA